MNYKPRKLAKGLYDYRGFLISYDDSRPDPLCWFVINTQGHREYFERRTDAQRQIDRWHWGLVELTQAPTNAQLAALDLVDYATPDLLLDLQRRLAAQGLGRSIEQLAQAAHNGSDGPAKRIMLSLVLSRLLGL